MVEKWALCRKDFKRALRIAIYQPINALPFCTDYFELHLTNWRRK
jgi:hypothetical protein